MSRVSQPSLSAQLAQLERMLGVRLFERDRRRVLVTAAGREIVERARLILRETEDLDQAARCVSDPLGGTLRIGVIPSISPYLLPRLTTAVRSAFPRLTLFRVLATPAGHPLGTPTSGVQVSELRGAGVTLLPALAIVTETNRAGLRIRSFAEPGRARTIALVWRRRSQLGPALRQLAGTVRTAYEGAEGPSVDRGLRHRA
jgi:DNA-binding transcriptional LysR family regulator